MNCLNNRPYSHKDFPQKSAGEIDTSNGQMQNTTGKLLIVIPLCEYGLFLEMFSEPDLVPRKVGAVWYMCSIIRPHIVYQ